MRDTLNYFYELDRKIRKLVRFAMETMVVLLLYSTWIYFYNPFDKNLIETAQFHYITFLVWCILYKFCGLDHDQLRFSNLRSYVSIIKITISFGLFLLISNYSLSNNVRYDGLLLLSIGIANTLITIRIYVRQKIRNSKNQMKKNILVYGTSEIANDLFNAMAFSQKYKVVGFIADMPTKPLKQLAGLPVITQGNLARTIKRTKTALVVVATDKLENEFSRSVLRQLDQLGVGVGKAPSMDRAFDYEVQLKAVSPEEVLGRKIPNTAQDFHGDFDGVSIFVTGAAGSIGSEISRQLIELKPKNIILLDFSEFALYNLEQELKTLSDQNELKPYIKYYLGSITDEVLINNIIDEHSINIVFHAAAYKHVPIVESNVIASIKNNVFGTKLLAELSKKHEIDKFILISSDKAVRPTNVMGATKRLAEIICQATFHQSSTKFSAVRFGNVLGSSGSVIPKFKSQIKSGGPVTVTHPDINRYFMSIPEAVNLVLNAGALCEGGEIFLFDMGKPVKILDLAKSMIRQHGLVPVVGDEYNDSIIDDIIKIEFTGLRSGEKLFEELLIDGALEKTSNPKIFKAVESVSYSPQLPNELNHLEDCISANDVLGAIKILEDLPLAFRKFPANVDLAKQSVPTDNIACKLSFDADKHPIEDEKSAKHYFASDTQNILSKVLKFRLIRRLLHRYFWLRRGMTLGVRVAITNRNNEILLVRHNYWSGWHFPGGGVDHGETAIAAARREVQEETGLIGIHFGPDPILYFNQDISDRDHILFYQAQTSCDEIIKKSAEIAEVRFFDLDNLPQNIDKNTLQRIEENVKQNDGSLHHIW